MAGEIPSSGNEIVDSLRGLQLVADRIDDPDEKIQHIRSSLSVIEARDLLAGKFLLSAYSAFGQHPENPESRIHFRNGMTFMGELGAFTYMHDPDIPVDSLTLRFQSPEVFGTEDDQRAAELFKELRLEVPVLDIDHCVRLDEAA